MRIGCRRLLTAVRLPGFMVEGYGHKVQCALGRRRPGKDEAAGEILHSAKQRMQKLAVDFVRMTVSAVLQVLQAVGPCHKC